MLFLIKDLKTKYNLQVQQLQCDNAGENQAFKWTCNKEGLGIHFKYTAPSIPQQNGRIERKFATLFNRVHAMLNGGKFTPYLHSGLWLEAANTATFIENHLTTPNRSMNPFQQFLGRENQTSSSQCKNLVKYTLSLSRTTPTGLNYPIIALQVFGLDMLKTIPLVHTGFFNPKTKCIILTWDVTFLNKSYGEYSKYKNLWSWQ